MTKRAWYEVSYRKLAALLAIPVLLAASLFIYTALFPVRQVACVIERNGDLIKAWDEDCAQAEIRIRAK